jgi:hypothetical protein
MSACAARGSGFNPCCPCLRRASLAPALPLSGVRAASARAEPPFDEQNGHEDAGDDRDLPRTASLDRRLDHEEQQRRNEDDADRDLK